jgi:hypothetical protein
VSGPSDPRRYEASLADGALAEVTGYAGEVLTFACERAHPPGEPLQLTVRLPDAELALAGKTVGSKRRDDGRFDVRLRLTSLRREQRSLLERAF